MQFGMGEELTRRRRAGQTRERVQMTKQSPHERMRRIVEESTHVRTQCVGEQTRRSQIGITLQGLHQLRRESPGLGDTLLVEPCSAAACALQVADRAGSAAVRTGQTVGALAHVGILGQFGEEG